MDSVLTWLCRAIVALAICLIAICGLCWLGMAWLSFVPRGQLDCSWRRDDTI
jgi:hypothetical protein